MNARTGAPGVIWPSGPWVASAALQPEAGIAQVSVSFRAASRARDIDRPRPPRRAAGARNEIGGRVEPVVVQLEMQLDGVGGTAEEVGAGLQGTPAAPPMIWCSAAIWAV